MECFNKVETEVNEYEELMKRKHSALIFSDVINYFKSLDFNNLKGDIAIYSFEINIPYNLSDEKLDEYKEKYYDLVSLGRWCDNEFTKEKSLKLYKGEHYEN